MQIRPILAALRKHLGGTILITLQISLTLAIVCNALFIIKQRMEHVNRPTGIDETSILVVSNHWIDRKEGDMSQLRADLLTLRQLPGVRDAYATNAFPLYGSGWTSSVRTDAAARQSRANVAIYFSDEHTLGTLGSNLIAGRNFRADEVQDMTRAQPDAPTVIITKALSDRLFDGASGLGKQIYLGSAGGNPSTVIGIVESLQAPSASADDDQDWQATALVPLRRDSDVAQFVVRANAGGLDALRQQVPAALINASRMREFPAGEGVRTFAEVRRAAYQSDRGLAMLMLAMSLALLAVTAAGIVGLTSFWVGQRHRQIGVRRALGATRGDILSYFLTENFLISCGGVIIGSALAIGLNSYMMSYLSMSRLSMIYLLAGIIILLVLGQAATLVPALRASRVSPAEATRAR